MRRLVSIAAPGLLLAALPFLMGPSCDPQQKGRPTTPAEDSALSGRGSEQDSATPEGTGDGGGALPARTTQSDAASGERGRCGTRGGVTCAANEFCNFAPDAQCGALDHGGMCQLKPEVCADIYRPVCGCDDKTYGNACSANAAGVSVKREGECAGGGGGAGEGATCGGIAGLSCQTGQFCNYEEAAGGQGCDGQIADAAGRCEKLPRGCTRDYRPVCGCDRRSYSNACEAHSKGASVLHEGACTEVDCKALGGRAVDGIGPPPQCAPGETNHTWIVYATGQIAIEGTACCIP